MSTGPANPQNDPATDNRLVVLQLGTQCANFRLVKYFAWNADKNESLKKERNISFEDVVSRLEQGDLVATFEHPNQQRYPGQRIYVVNIGGYAYLVPFVESETEVFLKTVIPSRKATNTYLRRREGNG